MGTGTKTVKRDSLLKARKASGHQDWRTLPELIKQTLDDLSQI